MRRHLTGTQVRPRLNVFRSGHHIYAQIIDDTTGKTIVAASTLEENLRNRETGSNESLVSKISDAVHNVVEKTTDVVEAAAEVLPGTGKGKGAKAERNQGRGSRQAVAEQPAKQKRTTAEQLVPIANNRKVALAREVGRLVAQRAKEKGVSRVVFDRGGYAYHGRVAALAEGAREAGLDF